ncbi:polyadenylate-binding protein, cytoplasmic and nuclear [Iris pallida]|uniref:Polyadenylate-binding protein, cytoplasmic and nuclear n=1 Tax=Iris pallida TaxID=29817 RepID=A0AAX6HGB1_IRIPA|nr:polyadenylate-binding protein, cytoplasmic and nuclear [Iris pallida]
MELLLRTLTPTPLNTTATPLLHLPSTITSVSFKRPLYSSPKLTAATVSSLRPSVAASSASAAVASSRWLVVMEKPPLALSSRADVIDYYVRTLAGVLPSEKDAQMCIYRAEWQGGYAFCCDIDEEASCRLAGMPGVLSVVPDNDLETKEKDYSYSNILSATQTNSDVLPSRFSPSLGNCKYWLVKLEKPGFEVVTKAQMVDYFVLILTKVLGNEKDAQVCIYNISWEKDFGFCCQIDKECAQELSDVPGVLSVQPDVNFESVNKDYKADDRLLKTRELDESSERAPNVKTKRLFVTGLSFYTSEKTLRAAFEPFGELVEVKIIMDKISKRSKGYAFIEYKTEEAGGAALKEMNGKIINGWMIVVDVAKTSPPKYKTRPRPPPLSSPVSY